MRSKPIFVSGTLLCLGMLAAGAMAPAEAQGYLGVAAGIYEPDDESLDRTEVYGVRGGCRFRSDLGVEASLSFVDLDEAIPEEPSIPELDIDFDFELYNLDFSLQWYPGGGNLVVFGGPGAAQIRARVEGSLFGETFSESASSEVFTAHAGLAYSWRIGDRFFLRPEVRARRYFDDDIDEGSVQEDLQVSYKSTDYEAGVMFAWRLGM
jgi:hypothetical protein